MRKEERGGSEMGVREWRIDIGRKKERKKGIL